MAPAVSQSVLVYDRISQNRLRTVLLVAAAVLSVVPFVAALSWGTADWLALNFGPHTHVSRAREKRMREIPEPRPDRAEHEYELEWRQQLDPDAAERRREKAENDRFRWQAMAIVAAALSGALGLLFWGLASSPTSRVLTLCGARAAGPGEAEAKRLLENLAIGAGLPVPRLYVIDTPVPNAFAAGMKPENSVVAVTSGLLTLLERRELEGVLAHELSHIGNRDTRLNTLVAAIALFLRLPALIRSRGIRERREAGYHWTPQRRGGFRSRWSWTLAPLLLYVFFVAPFIAAVMRALVSRTREYLADADAALLTRYPEGLLRALAKIAGAGSAVPGSNPVISHLYLADPAAAGGRLGLFTGNLLATHPPIDRRIHRLAEFQGGSIPASVVEEAVRVGKGFGAAHPAIAAAGLTEAVARDELSVLTVGNPMGRVFRTLAPTPLYDQPHTSSAVLERIPQGALITAFDDPGKFRQVLTSGQTFGYIPRTVRLQRVDMLPSEIYGASAPAAQMVPAAATGSALAPAPAVPGNSAAAVPSAGPNAGPIPPAKAPAAGLTPAQIAFAAGFFVLVLAGFLAVLIAVGK
jgi:heat shock protein HtpX